MNSPSTSLTNNSTEFPEAQKDRLREFLPAYEQFIREKNPDHKPRSKELTKWRNNMAKSLMREELFQNLVSTGPLEPKDWEDAIRRFFINHYNNVFLPALRRSSAASSNATSSFSLTFPSTLTLNPAAAQQTNSKALEDLYRRALVLFQGDLSPRELFASENEDALRRTIEAIQSEDPESDLVGGGLRNKALKRLWDEADQDLWKSKIEELAADINANREEFPVLIFQALQKLCSRERLGSILISFSWAFRDNNDGITGGKIFTGYDAHKKGSVGDASKPIDHKAQLDAWFNHADAVLSRKPRNTTYKIPKNEDGIPILPSVDIQEASASQVAALLDEYMLCLWDFSWTGHKTPAAMPWEEICRNPHHYFDTSVYQFPCALKAPQDMKLNPLEIFGVYQFLSATSTSMPFRFYSHEVILASESFNAEHDEDNGQPLTSTKPKTRTSPLLSVLPCDGGSEASRATRPSESPLPATPKSPDAPPISFNILRPNPIPPAALSINSPIPNEVVPTTMASMPPLLDSTVSNMTPLANLAGVAPAPSDEVAEASAASDGKKKKGRSNGRPKVNKNKSVASASVDDANVAGVASRVPTRTSTRSADLKRKQPDTTTTTNKPQPVKKTRMKDRWEYVLVPAPGPPAEK